MYYSGSAANYTDLRAALFSACTANGWALSTDVLTKGSLAIKVTVSETAGASDGAGVILQPGTGATGATLTNPSPVKPRLGPPSYGIDQPTFPITYEIFLFTDVDEVYLVSKSNVDQHMWLAFGRSTSQGIGIWASATSNLHRGNTGTSISSNMSGAGLSQYSTGCLFWQKSQTASGGGESQNQDIIHSNIDGAIWGGIPPIGSERTPNSVNALHYAEPLLNVSPNAWNSDSVLIRIKPLIWRASNKNSIVADLKYARYIRVDNFLSGQLIQLGPEYWKVFPFYRKNTTERNGTNNGDHTGTFGWAIRYDGPV